MKKSDILRLIRESDGRVVVVQERPFERNSFFLYHNYKFYPLDKYLGEPHPAGIKAGLTELGDWYHENGISPMLANNCARLWR